jgi:hypothetical protein
MIYHWEQQMQETNTETVVSVTQRNLTPSQVISVSALLKSGELLDSNS